MPVCVTQEGCKRQLPLVSEPHLKSSYYRMTSTFPTTTTSPTNGQHRRHSPEGITPSNLTSGLLGFSSMKFSAGGRCPTQVLSQECLQLLSGNAVAWWGGRPWMAEMTGGAPSITSTSHPAPFHSLSIQEHAAEITSRRHRPQGRQQPQCAGKCPEHVVVILVGDSIQGGSQRQLGV